MIRIRYENVDPVIVDPVYGEYEYQIHNGEFELWYQMWMGPDEPPERMQVGKGWNLYYEKIYLELETQRWTRKYSFAESPTVLMTAMSDYETEINLESITQEIEW
ncbi:MAG: hypothetical protein IK038_01150 [Bacteroidaceae bacterium]|nr:hypothetical protein [Bacteroidaceae bacterium]